MVRFENDRVCMQFILPIIVVSIYKLQGQPNIIHPKIIFLIFLELILFVV